MTVIAPLVTMGVLQEGGTDGDGKVAFAGQPPGILAQSPGV